MLARSQRSLTVEQFLLIYEGAEGKFELIDGEAYAMSGGSAAHNSVSGNIYFALRSRLTGKGCQPYNSDMGLRLGDRTLCYPDAAIYCDPRDLDQDLNNARDFSFPQSRIRSSVTIDQSA